MERVKVVSRWTGYCAACEVERPLVLADVGPRPRLREILSRHPHRSRRYVLSCQHCGTLHDVLV